MNNTKENKGMVCPCGKIAQYTKRIRFNGYLVEGWRCASCGESYLNPEQAQRILLLNKLKKMKYHLTLSKVRSNLILRIPKEVSDALLLKKSDSLELGIGENDQIIMYPLKKKGQAV